MRKPFLQSNGHVSQLTPQYLNPAWDMSPQHSGVQIRFRIARYIFIIMILFMDSCQPIVVGFIVGLLFFVIFI